MPVLYHHEIHEDSDCECVDGLYTETDVFTKIFQTSSYRGHYFRDCKVVFVGRPLCIDELVGQIYCYVCMDTKSTSKDHMDEARDVFDTWNSEWDAAMSYDERAELKQELGTSFADHGLNFRIVWKDGSVTEQLGDGDVVHRLKR